MPYSLFYVGTCLIYMGINFYSGKIKNPFYLIPLAVIPIGLLLLSVTSSGWVPDFRVGLAIITLAMWSLIWFFQDMKKDGRFFFPFTVIQLLPVPLILLTFDVPEAIVNYPVINEIRVFFANYLFLFTYPLITRALLKMLDHNQNRFSMVLFWITCLISISGIILTLFFPFGVVYSISNILVDSIWLILIFQLLTIEIQTEFQISFNRLGILALVLMMLVDDFSLFFDTLGNLLGLPSVGKENSYVRFYLNQVPQLFILSYFFIDYRIRQGFGIKLAKSHLD